MTSKHIFLTCQIEYSNGIRQDLFKNNVEKYITGSNNHCTHLHCKKWCAFEMETRVSRNVTSYNVRRSKLYIRSLDLQGSDQGGPFQQVSFLSIQFELA